MGIWDRLGRIIDGHINDIFDGNFGNKSFRQSSAKGGAADSAMGDPDLDAAYEELNDFLNGNGERKNYSDEKTQNGKPSGKKRVPEELQKDFECLGIPFGSNEEICKAAYKKLLKIHHPDRHAGHEGNLKKATEKSAKINAAFDRIEKWRTEVK